MKININFYKDKKGGYGLRIYQGGDINKSFIEFLKDNNFISSTKIDKNNGYFWLNRKDIFEQLKEIYEIYDLSSKLIKYKKDNNGIQ